MFHKVLQWKKKSATLLALALVAALSLQPVNVRAAAKSVAASEITLTVEDNIQVLVIGTTYDLTVSLSPSNASEKVTFRSSNPEVATVSKAGVITPIKQGTVTISATTKSGKKATKSFSVLSKALTTAYQSTMDKMVASRNISKIILKNMKTAFNYTIKAGDYSRKTIYVRAPYSNIKNYGVFKQINIVDVASKWREYGKGNSFRITDSMLHFVVDQKAKVKKLDVEGNHSEVFIDAKGMIQELNITAKDTKVNITADGSFDKIIINSNAEVKIVGKSEQVVIEVTKNAKGATVRSAIPVKATVAADATFVLEKGAETSFVEKTSDSVVVTITAVGVSSNGGKTATYTLPVAIQSLKSATVSIHGSVNKDYAIGEVVLKYVTSLLSKESFYLDLWESKDNITVTKGNLTVTAKGSGATKVVTFDGIAFTVTLNRADNNLTVVKNGSNVTYTLSKTNYNALTITCDTNTTVVDLLSFQVTY